MTPSPIAALYGLGFPHERLVALAAKSGLPLWGETGSQDGNSSHTHARVVVLLGTSWEDRISTCRANPFTAWIEVGVLSDQSLLDLIRCATQTSLYFSLTTATANRLNLSNEVLQALAHHRPLNDTARDNIEVALHEALSNALIHGNLQLDSLAALTIEALEAFSSTLMRRITDPNYANRRVDVACAFEDGAMVIDVVDQGSGFIYKPRSESAVCGRGIEFIKSSCQSYVLLDSGRRLKMRFLA
ncbi:MAG: ATP-binding protein [Rhodospirillaceae bacterium]